MATTERTKAEAMLELYELLKRGQKPTVRELPQDERRAHARERKRRSRERQRASAASGSPAPTADNLRAALADAALVILATGAPGADEIRGLLGRVYADRPGVVGTTVAKAKSGRLRPRLLTPERLSSKVE